MYLTGELASCQRPYRKKTRRRRAAEAYTGVGREKKDDNKDGACDVDGDETDLLDCFAEFAILLGVNGGLELTGLVRADYVSGSIPAQAMM